MCVYTHVYALFYGTIHSISDTSIVICDSCNSLKIAALMSQTGHAVKDCPGPHLCSAGSEKCRQWATSSQRTSKSSW